MLVTETTMPLLDTPTTTSYWTAELESARALYDVGDYGDAHRALMPIIDRPGVDLVSRLGAFLLKACIEWRRSDFLGSLQTLREAGPLIDHAPADLRGKYFGQRALAHRGLHHTDDALVDYEQARDCAIESGDARTCASIRNNIAVIYNELGRRDDALAEIDAAIKTFVRLRDDINLGNCYDTRAQVLIAGGRYAEALSYSKKAVCLLADDPAGEGARSTHGLAMIHVGAGYLDEKPKSIESFRARHDAAKVIDAELDIDLIKTALTRSNGQVLGAAKLLHVSHSVLIKLIARHGLERSPKRRRNKTLITK